MPIYKYTALNAQGAAVAGEGVAGSREEFTRELAGRGLLVQEVRAKRAGLMRARVRPDQFLLFNQEFVALIRAGLTVPDALKMAADRPDSPLLGASLGRVLEDVRAGSMLSEACARQPEIFDGLYLAALRTGEKAGALVDVLAKYQGYLRQRVALQKTVSRALTYPKFLVLVLVVVLALLFTFVMPRFTSMYAGLGAELPLATRLLMNFVNHLPVYGSALIGASALGWWAWHGWAATAAGRLRIDSAKQHIPLLGAVYRDVVVAQLARSLATLLAGGTPLVEALRTSQSSLTNALAVRQLADVADKVTDGVALAQAFKDTALFPPTAIKLVEVGEASGSLDQMMAQIAEFYEDVLSNRLTSVMALVEPVLMMLMGVLIGGVIIVMYLPIFYMAEVIK